MKYKFVYDKDFLKNRFFELNYEEVEVVRAIICGGHHALLYGDNPERLLDAIQFLTRETMPQQKPEPTVSVTQFFGGGKDLRKGCVSLADGGILFMENLHKFRDYIISLTTSPMDNGCIHLQRNSEYEVHPAHFQLVATTKCCECGGYKSTKFHCSCSSDSIIRWWNKMKGITSRCGIIYNCSEDISRTLVSVNVLKDYISRDWNSHLNKMGSSIKNCEIPNYEDLVFTDEAETIFSGKVIPSPMYKPIEIARVARTLADMRGHEMIRVSDVTTAVNWYQRLP